MEKLKILLVLQTPWGTRLGMSKVHYDLKQEYEKLGHEVNYLDFGMLYPHGQSVYDKMFGPLYSERILSYLKLNASKYDVIDANFNCIPYPKTDYSFTGLVVYRSHGLQPLYRQIEQSAAYKKMEFSDLSTSKTKLKTRIGNLKRFLEKKETDIQLFNSLKYADIVHALNEAEYNYFIDYGIPIEKLFLLPNGVPDERITSLQSKNNKTDNEISFLGSWTFRKGIKDLNDIVNEVSKSASLTSITLLGGDTNESVLPFFDKRYHSCIKVKTRFEQSELASLLSNVKVGIFPSYIEGFPLAVLEQLALGIPIVAYDTPGPSDILKLVDSELLIKPGDKEAFGRRVAQILNLTSIEYNFLASKCSAIAAEYKTSIIAQRFIDIYKSALNNKKGMM